MTDFLYKRLEVLRCLLKTSSFIGSKKPTVVGQTREKHFREFINDIFPYYDAFKGNVFGKNCDFVLADNSKHPRFNSLSDYNNYSRVITSLVDVIIDLKGEFTKQNLLQGLEQAKTIKSFQKNKVHNPNFCEKLIGKKYFWKEGGGIIQDWDEETIPFGLVFAKGKGEKSKIFWETLLIKYISFAGLTEMPQKITRFYITNENIEKFYKLPDFIYFIEDDLLYTVDKKPHFKERTNENGEIYWNANTFQINVRNFGMKNLVTKIEEYHIQNHFDKQAYLFEEPSKPIKQKEIQNDDFSHSKFQERGIEVSGSLALTISDELIWLLKDNDKKMIDIFKIIKIKSVGEWAKDWF